MPATGPVSEMIQCTRLDLASSLLQVGVVDVPDDQRQRAYWLVDGSDKKIPSTHMSKLINRIQSVMTRQKRGRQGFGYYL